jgi:hypothetical protein
MTLEIQGEQKAVEYAVKRFKNAFYNHHIDDRTAREVEVQLNRLTETIYTISNQKTELYKSWK